MPLTGFNPRTHRASTKTFHTEADDLEADAFDWQPIGGLAAGLVAKVVARMAERERRERDDAEGQGDA